ADERPELDEPLGPRTAADHAAVVERDPLVHRAGGDPQYDGVEVLVVADLREADGHDLQRLHPVAEAQRFLLLELDAKPLVDAVGDEGADGREVLSAPRVLELDEAAGDAVAQLVGAERRVA